MKWRAEIEPSKFRYCEIEYDPLVGYYIYVFANDICIFDHLQDSLEQAKKEAWEKYGVYHDKWTSIIQ